jgi:class 3 adenylate cyclase
MPPVRRLTAILAADMAGYSRLVGVDEEGTHERLRGHLRDLIEPNIAECRGRVVKNTGDGSWPSSRAWWTPSDVPSRYSEGWPTGTRASRREAGRVPGRD